MRKLATSQPGERSTARRVHRATVVMVGVRPMIALVRMGDVPAPLVESIASEVQRAFGGHAVVGPRVRLPDDAWDGRRRQYRASALLDALAEGERVGWDRLLGVADVDLFALGLDFVLGQADPRRGVAVLSLHRLGGGLDRSRLASTEAVHELGHTYGLDHCDDDRCVMWFSNTVDESLRKGRALCPAHRRQLDDALRASARDGGDDA